MFIIPNMLACLPYLYTISGELLRFARLGSWDPAKAPALATDVGSPVSTRVAAFGVVGLTEGKLKLLKSWNISATDKATASNHSITNPSSNDLIK